MGYDLIIIYKILKFVREHEGCMIRDLSRSLGMSFSTLSKYVDFMTEKGLLEAKGLRPKRLYVTKKGIDYLFMISQIGRLLNIEIA